MADAAMDVHEQGESKAKERSEEKKKKAKGKQTVHKDTNAAIKKGLERFTAADQDGDQ